MNSSYLSRAAAVALVVGLVAAPQLAQSSSSSKSDVRVINTAAEAIPVTPQGTTQIAGTVGIDGPVSVANQSGNDLFVRDVSESAEPFTATLHVEIVDGTTGNFEEIEIPAGKRLVLELVAGHIFLPSGQHVRTVSLRPDFGLGRFPLIPHKNPGTPSDEVYAVNQPLRMYAEEAIDISISRAPDQTGTANGFFSLSGYLVDA